MKERRGIVDDDDGRFFGFLCFCGGGDDFMSPADLVLLAGLIGYT